MHCPTSPKERGKCPFYILPNDPLSAEPSIKRCVDSITANNHRLQQLKPDFFQSAYLRLLESMPEYDPNHPSGASLTTFIKARVCTQLRTERSNELAYIPFSHTEDTNCSECDHGCGQNPLVEELNRQACAKESMENEVIWQLEVEKLREYMPLLLNRLSEKERSVIELKFFQEQNGVEIAKILGISEGRVSQISKTALEKVGKAYFTVLSTVNRNPHI